MTIKTDYLTPNPYSRPQSLIREYKAIVMHWTANPPASAKNNRDYFENRKNGRSGYGSAHYIIDKSGEILAVIPDNEVAYHCGSSRIDPASGKVYTDYARAKFGKYAADNYSPNYCTLGIELCPIDWDGNFSSKTIASAVELCVNLCQRFNLTADDITTHGAVVGWKDCPKLWIDKPTLFEAFVMSVKIKLEGLKK